MTHKRTSKACARCFSWSDPKATICFCWRAPSSSALFPRRNDFKCCWSCTAKQGWGEDRKELSPLNALSFELKIAHCTSKLISSFCRLHADGSAGSPGGSRLHTSWSAGNYCGFWFCASSDQWEHFALGFKHRKPDIAWVFFRMFLWNEEHF